MKSTKNNLNLKSLQKIKLRNRENKFKLKKTKKIRMGILSLCLEGVFINMDLGLIKSPSSTWKQYPMIDSN